MGDKRTPYQIGWKSDAEFFWKGNRSTPRMVVGVRGKKIKWTKTDKRFHLERECFNWGIGTRTALAMLRQHKKTKIDLEPIEISIELINTVVNLIDEDPGLKSFGDPWAFS